MGICSYLIPVPVVGTRLVHSSSAGVGISIIVQFKKLDMLSYRFD